MFKTVSLIAPIIAGGVFLNNTIKYINSPEAPILKEAQIDVSNPKYPTVTLDYTSRIMDKNLLYVTGFEEGDMDVNYKYSSFPPGHNRETGGQSLSDEHSSDGRYSTKIEDSYSNGNYDRGTDVYGVHKGYEEYSILRYKNRLYLPDNVHVSVTADVKATEDSMFSSAGIGGTIDTPPPWGNRVFLKDAKEGDTKVYVSGLNEKLKEYVDRGDKMYIALNETTEGKYSYAYITNINLDEDSLTLSHPLKQDFLAGSYILEHRHINPINFPNMSVPKTDTWTPIQSNARVNSSEFTISKRGIEYWWKTYTKGTAYVDNIRFGYANKIKLFRDNKQIYEGYNLSYKDYEPRDTNPPNKIDNVQGNIVLGDSGNHEIKVNFKKPSDIGTEYTYTAIANYENNDSPISNKIKVEVKSDIDGYSYIINNEENSIPDNVVDTGDTSISKQVANNNADYYIHIKAIDKAGNSSETIHYKIEPHRIDLVANEGNNNITLNWEFTDTDLSKYYFNILRKKDNGEYEEIITNYKGSSFVDQDTLDEKAPNEPSIKSSSFNESTNSFEYILEDTGDNGTIYSYIIEAYLLNGDKVSTSNTESISVESGLKGFTYNIDCNESSDIVINEKFTSGNKIIVPISKGKQYLHLRAIDNNGIQSNAIHVKAYDDVNPTLELRLTDYYPTNKKISIIATARDNTNIKYIVLPNGTKVFEKNFNYEVSFNGVYSFIACDIAGNATVKSISVNNIDTDKPSVHISKNPSTEWSNSDVNISIDGGD